MSNLPITRRAFFQSTAALFFGMFGSIRFLYNRRDDSPQIALAGIVALVFKENARLPPPISSCFLDQHSAVHTLEEQLWAIISADEPLGCPESTAHHDKLVTAITADYECNALQNVDGWYISETEYLMLSYLYRLV
ncbi:MAG: hypothetical protein R3E57_07515 [Porticoccaceae bacterium]